MIKVIIFDADGVIINGHGFYVPLAKEYGISNEKMMDFFESEFKECLLGKASLRDVLPPYLKKWGWTKSVDDFLNYWFKAEHNINEELLAYVQNIRQRGIKCYVGTNQEALRTEYMVSDMGFNAAFDHVFSSAHIGYKKPHEKFYSGIINELSEIKTNEILFWDDNQENIDAAKKLGINSELYISFEDFKEKMEKYSN